METLTGKVAFITGAARGQGRSHAMALAQAGADIIGIDVCEQFEDVEYPMPGREELAETVQLVENLDRRMVARQADVRDRDALQAAFDAGLSELGRVDIVLANAGVMPVTGSQGKRPSAWHLAVDVLLTGVYHTIEVALPALVEGGRGGSIVITSSTAGLKGLVPTRAAAQPGMMGYTAAKHGVVGLMRAYANALAAERIRVNTVHPTGVNSPMVVNEAFGRWVEEYPEIAGNLQNALPVDLVECEDISNAVVWLCSDASRYVTGVALPVDAGITNR